MLLPAIETLHGVRGSDLRSLFVMGETFYPSAFCAYIPDALGLAQDDKLVMMCFQRLHAGHMRFAPLYWHVALANE